MILSVRTTGTVVDGGCWRWSASAGVNYVSLASDRLHLRAAHRSRIDTEALDGTC